MPVEEVLLSSKSLSLTMFFYLDRIGSIPSGSVSEGGNSVRPTLNPGEA